MAIFHCQAKVISRASGRSSTAASAYRAGVELRDERTGEVHDYTRKRGVMHSEMLFPVGVVMDRAQLWNAAEAAEKRKDARVTREWELALPDELAPDQRVDLVREFARHLVERYGVAVDMAIHEPSRAGDQRNHHAHLLVTTRQISAQGLGEKTDIEREDKALRAQGKPSGREQIEAMRQVWAELTNSALERAGHDTRVDHRSLRDQGIDRTPQVHMGPTVTAMERRGEETYVGEMNRAIESGPRFAPGPQWEEATDTRKEKDQEREEKERRELEAEEKRKRDEYNDQAKRLQDDPDAQVQYVIGENLDPRELEATMPYVDVEKLRNELRAAADNPEAWGIATDEFEAWGNNQGVGRVRQIQTPSGTREEIVYDNF